MANEQTNDANPKRKRLDARDYKRLWKLFNPVPVPVPKKLKEGVPTPEIENGKLFSENIRTDNQDEVKSQSQDVNEAKLQPQDVNESPTNISKGCVQVSMSTALPEITHGERIEAGVMGANDSSECQADCMTTLPRYIEYWVPVALSYVQLEKYCETLLKSSRVLRSRLKSEVLIDSLHEVLTAIRKCCDHPYLVDSTLQEFVNRGRSVGDYLSNGIEVSGKHLVLGKLLEEIKRKHLRVLIVFQSNDSKLQPINLQHFLDDLVLFKVGKEGYVHIFREFDSSQKRATVDLFNDKDSGKLVMLIEKSSCQPNIKLSSMDCVILYNSDLSPNNDMKSLRKMTIQSKLGHLKVFRLYSSYSIEEKALTLAKEGTALESSLKNIGQNACHMLLLWGTSHLFSKLDEFHSHCSSIADLKCLSEDKLALDLVNEISGVLSCEDIDNSSCLLVSKVRTTNNDYSQNIVLHGEKDEPVRDDDLPPHVIWDSLLDGKNLSWKLLPLSSESTRRRGIVSTSPAQIVDYGISGAKMTSKKTSPPINELHSSKPRARKVCRPAQGKVTAPSKSHGDGGDESWSLGKIDEICMQRMTELVSKQKKDICEFYSNKRMARVNLEEEYQSEVNIMNMTYKEPAVNKVQLNNLDLIYKQKLEEHSRKMESKRQDLEIEHLASRTNEKQLKEKLVALLKTEDNVLIKSLLETPLGQQIVGLTENSGYSRIIRSNSAPSLESEGSQEIKHSKINQSVKVKRDDLESLPDQVLQDTEILSLEFEDGNVGISLFREEVCDTADCNIVAPGELNCEDDMRGATNSSTSATLVCKLRMEDVGDGDCNSKVRTGPCNEESEMRSATDSDTRHMIEELQVGEYNVGDHSGTSTGVAEMRDDSALGTFVTFDAQERIEGLHDSCNLEAHVRASNDHAEARGTGDAGTTTMFGKHNVETTECGGLLGESNAEVERGGATDLVAKTVVAHQMVEEAQSGPIGEPNREEQDVTCNIETTVGASNGEVMIRGAGGVTDSVTTTVIAHHMAEEAQSGPIEESNREAQDVTCNFEATVGASNGEAVIRGAGDSGAAATVGVLVEELIESSSSRLHRGIEALMPSQTCSMIGNSSLLEQPPVVYSNIRCHAIRPATVTSGLMNPQISRVLNSCQPGYTNEAFSNIGLCEQPVVQSQLQSSPGQAHLHTSSSDFQESSRYSQISSGCTDPLQLELERLQKKREELAKVYENKTQHHKFNRAKEIQEIENKYALLHRESENEFLQKELELQNIYRKVEANKLLAETFKSNKQKQISSSMSQEDLWDAFLETNPMRFNLHTQSTSVANMTPSPQLSPQPPVQVRELSELLTIDNSRPQNCSALTDPGNSLGYHLAAHSPAPHLRTSVSPQQPGVWSQQSVPRLYQMGILPRLPRHPGSTPQNPPLL